MDDAALVGRVERIRDLPRDRDGFVDREWARLAPRTSIGLTRAPGGSAIDI